MVKNKGFSHSLNQPMKLRPFSGEPESSVGVGSPNARYPETVEVDEHFQGECIRTMADSRSP